MAFQTLSTSVRSSRIWFQQSGWFQKSEDIPILQAVIKVRSKNNLIENSVLCHKNHSSKSAICVVRLSILLRLVTTRVLSPTALNSLKNCDSPWKIRNCHNSGCSANREIPRLFCTTSSPFKALVPILSLTDLFHSLPRLISVPM
jgi:hypothetical protein